jgi:hypothetical protein
MDLYHIYSIIKYKYVGVTDERNALALLWRGPCCKSHPSSILIITSSFFYCYRFAWFLAPFSLAVALPLFGLHMIPLIFTLNFEFIKILRQNIKVHNTPL